MRPKAYTAVASSPMVAVVYWVSFYVIGILMVFNVFGAFIIDVFIQEMENKEEQKTNIVDEEMKSIKTENGEVKILAHFQGSDDIYKDMFLEASEDN